MSVYYINSYDIIDFEQFKNYPVKAGPVILRHGGEVLVADVEAQALEGEARTMNSIIRFPTKEAALNCYSDPEYQVAKKIRQNSTKNCAMLLAKEFSR